MQWRHTTSTSYFCIFCAYFVHIFAYFNLNIMAYLPLMHIQAYNAYLCKLLNKTHIYAYFENAYLCIFGFAYLCIKLIFFDIYVYGILT